MAGNMAELLLLVPFCCAEYALRTGTRLSSSDLSHSMKANSSRGLGGYLPLEVLRVRSLRPAKPAQPFLAGLARYFDSWPGSQYLKSLGQRLKLPSPGSFEQIVKMMAEVARARGCEPRARQVRGKSETTSRQRQRGA
ncbi:hypothetical protein BJV74DRAFT_900785 [Russula compacta]|nr:hypothetical protein BJV74DRAFT_900785 [Russula compacta]